MRQARRARTALLAKARNQMVFSKGKWHSNQGGKYDGGHPTKQKQAWSAGWQST